MSRFIRWQTRILVGALFAALGLPTSASSQTCKNPDALGTSRTLAVGTNGGVAFGLKTYPARLALGDREVVLTFDDGPLPGPTGRVLDALARECVRATFFLIGRNAAASPQLARREVAEGHTVGHHSYSHPGVTMRGLSDAAARADIDRGFAAVDMAAFGKVETSSAGTLPRVRFFRFPGFADTKPLLGWLGSRNIAVFGADIWASDWQPMTPEAQLALVLARLEQARRGVILFHDTKAQTAAMLPGFLRALKARGYKVVHVVQGFGGSSVEPARAGWSSETERTLKRMWPRVGRGE